MVSRLIPIVKLVRWGGSDLTGDGDCDGRAIGVQWLGGIVEIAVGRVETPAEEPGRSYVTGGDDVA